MLNRATRHFQLRGKVLRFRMVHDQGTGQLFRGDLPVLGQVGTDAVGLEKAE